MEENESTEIELYEEIVGHLSYGTPSVSPAVSLVDVRELPPSQEPMPCSGNSESSLATTSRSALRPQLAGYPDEPRTVGVTEHRPAPIQNCPTLLCFFSATATLLIISCSRTVSLLSLIHI